MRVLYHYTLCPFSRKARVVLLEKKLTFQPIVEQFWQRNKELLILNPAGAVPVLVEDGKNVIAGSQIIAEYLEESHLETINLLGISPLQRAEVRRVCSWFDDKFYSEVSNYILQERVYKSFKKEGSPNSSSLRVASKNLVYHLEYIKFLLKKRKWLCGENFSLADITAACHISSLDYLNEISWTNNKEIKDWYVLIKSRPSFFPILDDKVFNFSASRHYKMLDF
jgi:glutathione S-transferase